jgi:hypothetical protein
MIYRVMNPTPTVVTTEDVNSAPTVGYREVTPASHNYDIRVDGKLYKYEEDDPNDEPMGEVPEDKLGRPMTADEKVEFSERMRPIIEKMRTRQEAEQRDQARQAQVEGTFAIVRRYFDPEWAEDAISMALDGLARGELDQGGLDALKWKWITRLLIKGVVAFVNRWILGREKPGKKKTRGGSS